MDSHTPIAVETQSTHQLLPEHRVRSLTPGAPAWDGIVEEGYDFEALTDPLVFWNAGGSQEVAERNMKRDIDSSNRFFESRNMCVLITSEYRIGGWTDQARGWHERD